MTLTTRDFAQFWREVHPLEPDTAVHDERTPFHWQQRLVDHIAEHGTWPAALDVPTGLGKTTALDIAVFTLALSRQGSLSTSLARRIFLVIDRRVVVDQAFEHAQQIADGLATAKPHSVTAEVAELLRPVPLIRHDLQGEDEAGEDPPLVAGRMRGGTTWAWRWLERPDQPAIIVGTIDQLGSRVLFDGYGVSSTARPVDAALTGSDSLILIDEAHLAGSFVQTLNDAQRFGQSAAPTFLTTPKIVVMSATTSAESPFRIDQDQEITHPVAKRRLFAVKKLAAVELKTTGPKTMTDTGTVLAAVAMGLDERFDVVGIVANTVATARQAFDTIKAHPNVEDSDAVLITGRQRPVDREWLWTRWRKRIEAGRDRQPRRLYVVATQTIEVGADLDFAAMITESASIDAVVQRLGRLNRRGDWADAVAVVVHPSTVTEGDPIYGEGRLRTWKWIAERTEPQTVTVKDPSIDFTRAIDVSPAAADEALRALGDNRSLMTMPRPETPVLFPSTLQRWVRTNPRPIDAAPTGPFLHGRGRSQPSVNIAWRYAGTESTNSDQVENSLRASVELLPVAVAETVEVPLWAFTNWWHGQSRESSELADLATQVDIPSQDDAGDGGSGKVALVVDIDGQISRLRRRAPAQATIVVPTTAGGLDQFGWAPTSSVEVLDVADLVDHRGFGGRKPHRRVLRLARSTLSPYLDEDRGSEVLAELVELREELDNGVIVTENGLTGSLHQRVAELLAKLAEELPDSGPGGQLRQVVGNLVDEANQKLRPGVQLEVPEAGVGRPQFLLHSPGAIETWSSDRSAFGTSASGKVVELDRHQEAVAARTRVFAEALGFDESVTEACVLAARFHDCGKLDPRFQQMLNGGQFIPAKSLAKSGFDPAQTWRFAAARRMAGYPSGMRHEAFSAKAVGVLYRDHPERDLIIHLVGAHHGRGRPLEHAVTDPDPVTYTIDGPNGRQARIDSAAGPDWDQPRRFNQLNKRFGPWGLAMLETVVRLADIGCSSEGS